MADAAISFAVQKLGDALIQKVIFLKGVEEQVRWLKDELERMQCFLKDAAEKRGNDERICKWISDIREVAYDAEDVVETFILKVEDARRSRGMMGRCGCFPVSMSHLNRAGKLVESIRTRLDEIEKSRQRYGIENLGEGMDSSRRSPEYVERRRRLAPSQKDKHVVGLNEDVELLLDKSILEKKNGLSIAAIVGMGGIGKSTLARKIYNHPAVVARFDCCAWVVVSSEFTPEDIIKQIMLQLQLQYPTEDGLKLLDKMKKLQESTNDKFRVQEMLGEMLRKHLVDKQYFIVLDDVWEYTHWESLKSAFPDEKDKASRLLFTSRNQIITECQGYIHKMRLLDADESWELLLKTAFIDKPEHRKCPQGLENIGREILKKCDGLPLAITVAGGLLMNQGESKSGWEKVLKERNSQLDRSGSRTVSAILELSYHNLPPELKACFLCLGFFKEDVIIRAGRLIHIWIAQGFIPQGGGEETMEEIARGYLDELINRNLVQVKEMNKLDNRVRTCHIHDLLRELSIRKAKEEISFEILKEDSSTGTISQSSLDKPRHCSAYYTGSIATRSIDSSSSVNPNISRRQHLRSLFFIGDGIFTISPSYNWKSFELLRVLDFEDFGLKSLPEAIGTLIELRYLGLRRTHIHMLPSSLGLLKNLEVLDVRWNVVKMSNVLWKMDSLRHLYVDSIHLFKRGHLIIGTLKNIQTLKFIPLSAWMMVEHPTHMTTSLRKLGIEVNVDLEDVNKLSTSLAMLQNLVCLDLIGSYYPNLDGFDKLHCLTKLRLKGRMTRLPSPSNFPPNLSCLTLIDTSLSEDPMPVLEKLPNLLHLRLDYAYFGEEMVISHDGFPTLKQLYLGELSYLNNIKVGNGGMPMLKLLEIYRCQHLESTNIPENLRLVMSKLNVQK